MQGVLLGERYRVERLLGQGGMGCVYQASDEARSGLQVAVKLLAVHQPQALYRLKNEFRALAATVHPNLVGLHGLGVDPQGWFLVMDLVAPCSDFLSYVRGDLDAEADQTRLRSALVQLLRGVSAIHAAGKLHRDLKPSNVLVTNAGRVVIADFGLVGDQEPGGEGHTQEGWFAGTPAYAAPEQASAGAVGTKADMYAIGVLLFEALTGRLPIEADSSHELLERKARESAPDLSELGPHLPRDLSVLCNALLRRDPALRPSVAEALAQLDEGPSSPTPLATFPFVARKAELAALHEATLSARQGAPIVALVSGPSGIGKSALVAQFLEQLRQEPGTVQLRGRCHAHEQVPYNAFDSLVDSLGRYLAKLAPVDAASLMPRDVTLLARLFPTLLRIPAVLQMPAGRAGESDEGLHRLRAFAALKELLARIADRSFLVVCFDDLQWSDDDSRELLRELLRGPGAPAGLFVCALRAGDWGEDERVPALLRAVPGVSCIELPLMPLDPPAASELVRAVLGEASSQADLKLLIEEAQGSPFLLKELSRGASLSGAVAGLFETVAAATRALDPGARALLELVCVAGQPLELQLAIRAARVAAEALPQILASALLRTSLRAGREYLESSHQRISDAVVEVLAAPRRATLHAQLAQALGEEAEPDPERIAHHYRAAGRLAEALPHTIAAAARAARMLAFGRSAELYEVALREVASDERAALELALADAYESMGRLNEAAECYERASERAELALEKRRLASKAMQLLLLAGQTERGLVFVNRLCRELSVLAPPKQPWLAVLVQLFLVLRFLLGKRIRALPVPVQDIPAPLQRERLDLCFRAGSGLFNSRPDACTHFTLLALIEVRRARDPHHWPIALAAEALWRRIFQYESGAVYDQTVKKALSLAEAGGDEEIVAGVLALKGIGEMNNNCLRAAVNSFERAEAVLNASGRSAIQVYHATRSGRLISWIASGQLEQLVQQCGPWIAEAHALGDHYGELMVRHLSAQSFLALDDPESARAAIMQVRAALAGSGMGDADPWWLGDVALYEGDARAALAEDALARSSPFFAAMQRVPSHRVWSAWYLARASLLAAAGGGGAVHLRRAEREVHKLLRERLPLAEAAAAQVRAGLALLRDQRPWARTELERAQPLFASCGMELHVEALRFRLGGLLGGDEGEALIRSAEAKARALGARNPARWFCMLMPGPPVAR